MNFLFLSFFLSVSDSNRVREKSGRDEPADSCPEEKLAEQERIFYLKIVAKGTRLGKHGHQNGRLKNRVEKVGPQLGVDIPGDVGTAREHETVVVEDDNEP